MTCDLSSYDELANVLQSLPVLVRGNRRAHRLSLRAAASEVGCSFSTLARLEAGEVVMSDVVQAVLRWLARAAPEETP